MTDTALPLDADAAHAREILRDRARELARVPEPERRSETLSALTFAVAGERFALESRYVVGVCRVTTLTLLPAAASPLIGITEWHGDLLTLLDLRSALGYAANALADRTLALVLGDRQPAFGVLVDAVLSHDAVPLADLTLAADTNAHPLVRGITADGVLLLDAPALLALP